MWRFALCFFLILAAVVAQEQVRDPKKPTPVGGPEDQSKVTNSNDPDADLLAIIKKLTDDTYVQNELTFEQGHPDLDIHKSRFSKPADSPR